MMRSDKTIVLGMLASLAPIGAYGETIRYVDKGSTCTTSCGLTWATAHKEIQNAISADFPNGPSPADEVWVKETPQNNAYDPIGIRNGVKVIGGFDGTETVNFTSSPVAHKTYISGGGVTRAVESWNADSTTWLRGFYIVDGFTSSLSAGGGLRLFNSNMKVIDCVFRNNGSDFAGGALEIDGGSPDIINCQFDENGTDACPGSVVYGGGAVYIHNDANPTFTNCLFHHNKAGDGGAVAIDKGTPKFYQCTFAHNDADVGRGGAIYDYYGTAELRNCIVWNNTAVTTGTAQLFNAGVTYGIEGCPQTSIEYTCFKGGYTGTGNISTAPRFWKTSSPYDYNLKATSNCIDVGLDANLPADVADLDWDGNVTEAVPNDIDRTPRIFGTKVDMGAYEAPDGNAGPPGEE